MRRPALLVLLVCVFAAEGLQGAQKDVSNYFVNLRREKMRELKKELELKGASLASPDVDPNLFSGMKRLRILQTKAHVKKNPSGSNKQQHGDVVSVTTTQVDIEHTPHPGKELMLSEGFGDLSRGASIGIGLAAGVVLLLVIYVVYKYMSWKPKMIARKGYRAVSRSKGLGGVDGGEAGGESSDPSKASSGPTSSGPPTLLQAKTRR